MKRYDKRRTEEIRKQLFKGERWNTDTVMNILHLLIEKEPSLERGLVDVVDSGFLSRVVDSDVVPQHSIEVMQKYLSETKLLLLPVFSQEHWSLLVYLKEGKVWYHCDSMGQMHSERVNFILARLHLLKIYDGLDQEQRRVSFHPLLKKQEGQDECGTYLTMYAMSFIFNIRYYEGKGPLEEFQSILEGELVRVNEDKRHEYLQRLDTELVLMSRNDK